MTGDGSSEPDAFIVVHNNPDGVTKYGVGPFPPNEDLADALIERGSCDCRREVLWIRFPAGIRMLVGVDITDILDALTEITSENEQAQKDRLN